MTQDPKKTKQCRGVHATLAGEVVVVVSGWWTIDIVMAADGRDRKTIGGNPRLVPALPHSRTPHQPRTDFKLVSHYPDLGLRIIVHISQKFQLLGARSAEPELLSYLRHSQHFASAADTWPTLADTRDLVYL